MNKQERTKNWSNYWESNNIESCTRGVQSEDSEIDIFWDKSVNGLTDKSKVMDLCTGKGDVIKKLIGKQVKEIGKVSNFTGVDIADLSEEKEKLRFGKHANKVDFKYRTSIEELPFGDETFDLITSQFGIEYAIKQESINEIIRVLKPKGRVRLVMHHSGSVLTEVANEELSHIDYLFQSSNFITLCEKLLPVFAKLRNPANAKKLNKDQTAISLRSLFNQASSDLLERANKSSCPDVLNEVLSFSEGLFRIAREQGIKPAKEKLLSYKKELAQSKSRMKDLVDVALSKEDIKKLEEMVDTRERKVKSVDELQSNNQVVAWGIEIA